MGYAPWSYSGLTAFETCPRRFYLTKVARKVKEPPTEATIWGNKVHKALEERAKGTKALPKDMRHYEKYTKKILNRDGKKIVEAKLAVTAKMRPTDFFAKDAWCRGIVDLGIVNDEAALLLDWKTGKRKPGSDQLKLMACLGFAHYPWIDRVVTGFIWLKEKKFDRDEFHREQLPEMWSDFMPRVDRLSRAYEEDKWVPRPSGLCKNWCPVGDHCEFCGV